MVMSSLRKVAMDFVAEFVNKYIKRKQKITVLEVGATKKMYAVMNCVSKKSKYIGINAQVFGGEAEKSATTLVEDICELQSIPPRTIDVVVMIQTLEHVWNPFKAIENIHKVLKEGGMFYVDMPYNKEWHGRGKELHNNDYWRITSEGMKLLLRNFSSSKVRTIGYGKRPDLIIAIAKK